MKKYLKQLFAVGLLVSSLEGMSQLTVSNSRVPGSANPEISTAGITGNAYSASEDLKKSNPRIFRNLSKYDNISKVVVSRFPKFISVYCEIDGISNRFVFDKSGRLMHTIRFYKEDKLDKQIRHIVKREYYDHQIFGITEVNIDHQTAYLVTLQDADSWVTVKVQENEITPYQYLTKN